MPEHKFPDYFPSNCPPPEAENKEIIAYRFCNEEVASEEDFLSHYILDPEKFKGKVNAYGLSIFSTYEAAMNAKAKMGALKKKKSCYCGITYKNTGVILLTERTHPKHHTWWLYVGASPVEYFKVCFKEMGDSDE